MDQPISQLSLSSESRRKLEHCRFFEGPPDEFWTLFCEVAAEIAGASRSRALVRFGEQWRALGAWPAGAQTASRTSERQFNQLSQSAFTEGFGQISLGGLKRLVFARLETEDGPSNSLLELELTVGSEGSLAACLCAMSFLADTPRLYLKQLRQRQLEDEMARTGRALEVLAAVNAQRRFSSATMALVNEAANRFEATRVTFGWVESPYVKAVAMSGTEKFERAKQSVQRLEAAMEEARDQEDEIFWPPLPESDVIARDHESYGHEQHLKGLLSTPLRVDGETCGVLLLEREAATFSEEDALGLRVIGDQTARYLNDLKQRDRWFGARWARGWRKGLSKLVGPKHTWMKVAALTGMILLIVSLTVPIAYNVDGTFIVRPERSAHLPAPFEGYLAEVNVRPGDEVNAGDPLVEFDRGDLRVQEADALAEIQRYQTEAERAEAESKPADLRVAKAMAEQARARLALVRFRLDRASIRSPFDGVVIAGDLRDRIGAPMEQGAVLMQVAKLEGLFVEIKLPERDIDLLSDKRIGELAFASRPDERFPIEIERIEPGAVPESEGNFFIIRARLMEDAEWLRPGMSGVVKLDGGERTLAWWATHRLVDFLRMKLWW
ncbi:efflux RND transporter periplasmic adaptor subunit [Pelagicoccus sp. SDUM812002]|uniref:efflux RND transporter periplasmic adaptor subunit n=1 Tax=Pelagicoccus sp. SDUM812002 TaxID=3041266 RepID=UPI00280DC184|nr:efflux RND transporter periplasmic adaptor subunit [Pelagicoccus sp. SDUM812002]MDQ8186504.1 efflux RND transporter periplasmic adaptor subunit [Pelagicoccus sp. SDUM812002]